MTIEQFQELELSFIHDLKQSEPYLSCKTLSSQLEENEEIISLVKERDSLLLQAEKTEDSTEKAEVLKQYLKKQEEIDNHPLMKEYLSSYQRLNRILLHLQDELNKEILL